MTGKLRFFLWIWKLFGARNASFIIAMHETPPIPESMQHKSHQQGTRYDFLSISQVESYHFPQILTLHQPFISWYQQPWVETDQHIRCKGTLGSTFSWWISTWYSSITSGICRGADGEVACLFVVVLVVVMVVVCCGGRTLGSELLILDPMFLGFSSLSQF